MTIGPVEYIIVGFPGNKFTGEIAPELMALVESETIRVLDLIFIGKDADGSVVSFEIDELDALAGFGELDADVGGLISPEDVEYAAAALEPNSSAALLIWEDVWASRFAEAVRRANGVLLEGARIPHELIAPILADLLPAVCAISKRERRHAEKATNRSDGGSHDCGGWNCRSRRWSHGQQAGPSPGPTGRRSSGSSPRSGTGAGGCPRSHRTAHPTGRAEGLRRPDRGGVRGAEGQASGLGVPLQQRTR
jgi:hypothetical protein